MNTHQRPLPRVTLPQLLKRAVPYERWRAPFAPRLQVLSWLAGGILLLHLLFIFGASSVMGAGDSPFFIFLGDFFSGIGCWVENHAPLLLGLNLAALLVCAWLVWRTRGLRSGKINWHYVAFGETAVSAVGAFPMFMVVFIVVFNLFLWVGAVILGLSIVSLVLAAISYVFLY